MADIQVVIMAGGIGSRLWPLSTPDLPKQFVDVLGVGKTLIQMTVDRFLPVCPIENIWIVTSEHYESIVREQLPSIPTENILLEPVGRNTAPCIAYACRKIAVHHPNATVVVTPSDAMVLKTAVYTNIIRQASDFVSESDEARIVTIGIEPTRPETGYGYICASKAVLGELVRETRPEYCQILHRCRQLFLECRSVRVEGEHHSFGAAHSRTADFIRNG